MCSTAPPHEVLVACKNYNKIVSSEFETNLYQWYEPICKSTYAKVTYPMTVRVIPSPGSLTHCCIVFMLFRARSPTAHQLLLGPRCWWVDNIKMEFREIGWVDVDWIDMAQDSDHWRALVKTALNLRVPWNAGKFLSGCTVSSSSRRAQFHE
jgi:hypothetical protein